MVAEEVGSKRKLEDVKEDDGDGIESKTSGDAGASGNLTRKGSSSVGVKKGGGTGVVAAGAPPSTPKRTAKGAGGPSRSSTGKSKAQKKQVIDTADDAYDDEYFDLPRMMKLEADHGKRLTPEQMKRYEHYRRSDLKKEKVKKLLTSVNLIPLATPPADPFIICVKGLAKVFVGEIVENSLDIQKTWGESGPLHPKHIREAHRRMVRDGNIPFIRNEPDFPLKR